MPYEAIVIGVSSGGLDALKILFSLLPADFGMSLVIVQHLSPRSESEWIKLLDQKNRISVTEIEEKEKMQAGTAYFAPPNYHVLLEKDRTFSLSADARVNFARPSVDVLFDSAADVLGDKLIGVVLTGANSDGAAGLKKIKDYGGLTIVQDPATSLVPAMPRAAIATMKPDHILSLHDIGILLLQLDQQQKNQHVS
jgi:two-component system chemotaxis response regulator CheB